jgi:tetratricopeptide (TPR) repeat protein
MRQHIDRSVHVVQSKGDQWERKRIMVPVLVVIIAILVAIVFWIVSNSSKHKTAYEAARDKASDTTDVGEYAVSLDTLKNAESAAKTKRQKLDLYADISAAAASSGDITQAIEYLQKRHQLDPATKSQDAYFMGSYYERLSEIDKALAQYELAVTYKRSQDPKDSAGDIASLQMRISEIKAGQ